MDTGSGNEELKILYLEDIEEDAVLVKRQLKQEGLSFKFDHVSAEHEFRDKLNSEKYDVILSDYNLPGFSGIAALLISRKICPDVPFICISGTIGEEMAVELIHMGASDYILKDNLSKLHVAIQRSMKDVEERNARIKAERMLVESEARLRDIILSSYDLVWEIDRDWKYTYISENVKEILGYTVNEVIRKSPFDFMPSGEKERITFLFNEHVRAKRAFRDMENWNIHRNGNMICLLTSGVPVFDDKGDITGYRGAGKDITDPKLAEREITNMRDSLERLNQHLDEVREEERASIAREIHDQLGQSLTALKIDVEWLHERFSGSIKEAAKLEGMNDLITIMIKDVQRIASELRPSILDDLGLVSAMEWYINEFEQRTGVSCRLKLENIEFTDDKKNLTLYRILQEALTNVSRHADADNVEVSFFRMDDIIKLEIYDDGKGLAEEAINSYKSLGFIGIRERLKKHNGNLEIHSRQTEGTRLSITLPFN
ncbi:MAG: PAS domain S-box protein [Bacteroidales bacterium]|nr:PAS domain S-box protein [Bacteroidales bacterium]